MFVSIVCLSITSPAQQEESTPYISRGQWLLGGTISLSAFQNLDNPNFKVSTSAGYLLGKRFALGLHLSYSFIDRTITDEYVGEMNSTYNVFSINPTARFYIGTKRFSPFADVGYGLQLSKIDDINKQNYDQQFYRVGIGFNYFLTPAIAIENIFSYSYFDNNPFTNNSDPSDALGLTIGIQFFLSRNQKGVIKESNAAHIEKGKWMLGGTIDLTPDGSVPLGYNNFSFNPEVGYFLKNNLALGLRLSYQEFARVQCTTFNPFARYYFVTKSLAPFVDASFGWGLGNSEVPFETWEHYVTALQVGVGLNYFVNDFVALESKLNYGVNTGFEKALISLEIGLKFFVPRKK